MAMPQGDDTIEAIKRLEPPSRVRYGQTGVDRGALEAAVALGLEFGGWAPSVGIFTRGSTAVWISREAASTTSLASTSATRSPTNLHGWRCLDTFTVFS